MQKKNVNAALRLGLDACIYVRATRPGRVVQANKAVDGEVKPEEMQV